MNLNGVQRELAQLEAQITPRAERKAEVLDEIWGRLAQMAERMRQRPEGIPPPDPEQLSPMGRIALKMSQATTAEQALQTFTDGIDELIQLRRGAGDGSAPPGDPGGDR